MSVVIVIFLLAQWRWNSLFRSILPPGCDVVFYTNARFESEPYAAMVERLYALQDKWGIGILDLWGSDDFNNISGQERSLYMYDTIHPLKAGYRDWWGPELERQLVDFLNQ